METSLYKFIYKSLIKSSAHKTLQDSLKNIDDGQADRWTKDEVNILLKNTWVRVDSMLLKTNLNDMPTIGSRHNVFLAIVTTAAYRELISKGISQNYAARLIADVGWKLYALGIKIYSLPFRLTSKNPAIRIERTIKLLMKFPFSAPGRPAYEATVWKQDNDYFTHWTWCPPQAYVRQLVEQEGDHGELEAFYQSWCLYDWPGADIMAGDGQKDHYQRRLTQSKGDKVCDMCWKASP